MSNPNSPNPFAKTPEGLTFDDGANTCHIRPRSSIALEVLENRSGFTRLTGAITPTSRGTGPYLQLAGAHFVHFINQTKIQIDAILECKPILCVWFTFKCQWQSLRQIQKESTLRKSYFLNSRFQPGFNWGPFYTSIMMAGWVSVCHTSQVHFIVPPKGLCIMYNYAIIQLYVFIYIYIMCILLTCINIYIYIYMF